MNHNNWLLWSDPHFVDSPLEDYRWSVFEHLRNIAIENHVNQIVCLGDAVDRKDHHSSVLVNRLIEEFSYLQIQTQCNIQILAGNHDRPLNGPYYWKFLSKLGIEYITEPTLYEDVWFLPFSPDPINDWKDLDLNKKAIFMHQTGQGATVEGGRELVGHNLPEFPKDTTVFSGDVHRSQIANSIHYIGTPHPIRFSESWDNYVILVENDDFKNYKRIKLPSIKRAILEISSVDELKKTKYGKGDQVRIRYQLTSENLTDYPNQEQKIRNWASENQVYIASLEAQFVDELKKPHIESSSLEMQPLDQIVRSFGEVEKLDQDLIEAGLSILSQVKS